MSVAACSLLILLLLAAAPKGRPVQPAALSPLIYLCFLSLGFLNARWQTFPEPENTSPAQTVFCRGELQSFPIEKANSWQWLLAPKASTGLAFQKQEKILINLAKPHNGELPKPGDCMLLKGIVYPAADPPTPGGFDYAGYLQRQGIRYRLYVPEGELLPDPLAKPQIQTLLLRIRTHLYKLLEKQLTNPENRALAAAILLGQRQLLEKETRADFAGSGIVHLLAVSGLHVGIIYLFFSQLFLFIRRRKYGNLLHAAGCLTVIWLYAFITGGSPSVLRASVMLSFLIGGQLLRKDHISLNAVLASAFLLLLFNPSLLCETGFQLSYLAVISILLFYPLLEGLLHPRTKVGKYLWQLTALSLTAQAGTLPLSLFYFHSLPLWFLPVNLLAVPLTGLILYTGMSFFLLSWLPPLASLLSALLDKGLSLLNGLSHTANQLPLSHLEPVCIHPITLLFIYLAALLLYHTLKQKRITSLFSLLLLLLLAQAATLLQQNSFRQKVWITFYNGYTAFEYSILKEGQFYYPTATPSPEVLQHQLSLGISKGHPLKAPTDTTSQKPISFPRLMSLEGKRILLLNGDEKPPAGKMGMETDFLILGPEIPSSWKKWLQYTSPAQIIHIGNSPLWEHICQWQKSHGNENQTLSSYQKGHILSLNSRKSRPKK